jgi:hypothetical protein
MIIKLSVFFDFSKKFFAMVRIIKKINQVAPILIKFVALS